MASYLDQEQATLGPGGSVTVTNFPATQNVAVTSSVEVEVKNDAGNPIPVSGTVAVSNFPATQNVAVTSSVEVEVKNDAGNPIPVSGTFFQVTQPISGSVSVSNFPATQPVSGTVTANQGTANSIANAWPEKITDGTNTAAVTAASALKVDGSAVTQPISAVSLPLPSGAATSANQTTANTSLASIDSKLTNPLPISGSVSVSNFPVTQSVSGTVTAVPSDGNKATYSASASAVVPAVLATDIFTISGSATKTIRITKAYLDGTSTGGVNSRILAIKRSTVDTGGTSTTLTNVPHDSTQAAATVTVLAYTANPTLGTTVGTLRTRELTFPTPGSQVSTDGDMLNAVRPAKAVTLRSASEQVGFSLNGVTLAGGLLNFNIEWTEE